MASIVLQSISALRQATMPTGRSSAFLRRTTMSREAFVVSRRPMVISQDVASTAPGWLMSKKIWPWILRHSSHCTHRLLFECPSIMCRSCSSRRSPRHCRLCKPASPSHWQSRPQSNGEAWCGKWSLRKALKLTALSFPQAQTSAASPSLGPGEVSL